MVSRVEINAITVTAEEREHQKYLRAREQTKEETRTYCSTTLSDQLKVEADKPSRCLVILTNLPDSDGEVKIVTKDTDNSSYYTPTLGYYNFETMINFIKDHGFDVVVEDSTYRYNRNTTHSCKKVSIKW